MYTESSAAAVIADRTAYDALHSRRPLSGVTAVWQTTDKQKCHTTQRLVSIDMLSVVQYTNVRKATYL